MAGPDTSAFTTVKEQVDLEEYLTDHLGVDLVPSGAGRTTALCPFHAEDTPSFVVEDTGDGWKRWHCYGACQEGGTVIDAAMKAEGFELAKEAIVFLNDLYGLELDINMKAFREFAQAVSETENEIKRTREEMEGGGNKAKIAERYLLNRGLSRGAIEFFQLGLDTKQTKGGRISIPLIDKANHPISIANRALFEKFDCRACGHEVTVKEMVKQRHDAMRAKERGEGDGDWSHCPYCQAPDREAKVAWLVGQNPKYKFVSDFDKAEFLYNENSTRRILNKEESVLGLFLAEGYGEVWAGWMSDNKAFCSYSGAVLSDWQAREAVELVKHSGKPVILVPDFDATGLKNVDKNIRKLRAVSETLEIQVVHGIKELKYKDHLGEEVPCKDLGDVLQHFGPEQVAKVVENGRWAAAEWQIRQILGKRNAKTGEPFHSREKQMALVAEVLSTEHSRKVSLDHMVEYLANIWDSPTEAIRNWFYSNLSEDNATSYQYLFKDIEQSRLEAQAFLKDTNVIPLGFKELDDNMPGGGARPGQLAMALGKSGTGKSQPLHARIRVPGGWRTMGEMQIGDEVVNPAGGTANVVGVFPQEGLREICRIQLCGDLQAEADIEHIWLASVDGIECTITTRGLIAAHGRGADLFIPIFVGGPRPMAWREVESIDFLGRMEARCIKLDSENELYVTDNDIVTHNTMLASQMLANMADHGVRSIFFSLEQAAKSLFARLVSQALDVDGKEAERLIRNEEDDPEIEKLLDPVRQLYRRMLIVDNVPTQTNAAMDMTPSRVQAIIQEANLTHFEGESAQVVIIDHLGILHVDEDAPRDVKGSDLMAPGYIMQKLFEVCKATNVFMLVLQQLPKEVPPGKPFGYDAGRGGSKQTDFCDYILQIYRPEQADDIDDEERVRVEGQYKIVLGKNRYGGSSIFHGIFDKSSLRIMPALKVAQPGEINDTAVIDLEDEEIDVPPELRIGAGSEEEGGRNDGETGKSPEQIEALARRTDDQPVDAMDLLKQIGARPEGDRVDEESEEMDPVLGAMFEA